MSLVRTITFTVDTSQMFDVLHDMNGDFGPVGQRLTECLLGGVDWTTSLGLQVYGISIDEVRETEA